MSLTTNFDNPMKHTDYPWHRLLMPLLSLGLLIGCATAKQQPPIDTVQYVDLRRFMGDWYVIAAIPTTLEKEAYNAVESYRLNADGTVATTFTFRKGDFNGPIKRYNPTGSIVDKNSNALWGMQFIWPIKAEYRIAYLDDDYQHTIIARNARDYVWIMARTPVIDDGEYQRMVALIKGYGYDVSRLRKVPQKWD
jgi:apolipoprotein D and lipocalin family protein